MPLSPSVQKELREELERIEAAKKHLTSKLDERARVILAVLEPFEVQSALPFVVSAPADSLMKRLQEHVTATVGVSKFASTGLRAAILDVLRQRGPARAPNVAAILSNGGFKNDSKTALATRVYNDLWRMKEAGIVENKEGVFSLKEVA
jgi:hypothetical protein